MDNSIGKIIIGSVIGLIAGLLAAMGSVTFVPVLGAVFAWLYAWAGVIPAGVFAFAGIMVANFLGGNVMIGSFVLMQIVPAALAISCIRRKFDYKKCMLISVVAQISASVLTLGLVWMATRMDIVDRLMQNMALSLGSLPPELLNQMFNPNALQGSVYTAEQLDAALNEALTMFDTVYRIGLPGMVLSYSLLTGIFNVALPVWVWARSGDERGIRRVPVSEWRVPESAAIGMPLCIVLGIVLDYAGVQGGDAVSVAVQMVFRTMLQIQCMGAFSRLAKRSGASLLMRGVLVVGALTFASQVAVYLGAYSLYLGSKGLISTFLRNKMNNNQKGDE